MLSPGLLSLRVAILQVETTLADNSWTRHLIYQVGTLVIFFETLAAN